MVKWNIDDVKTYDVKDINGTLLYTLPPGALLVGNSITDYSLYFDGTTLHLGGNVILEWSNLSGTTKQNISAYNVQIIDGTRNFVFNESGINQTTVQTYTAQVLQGGQIVTPISYSWICGGILSGTSLANTFTPSIGTYTINDSFVQLSIVINGMTLVNKIPISVSKKGDKGDAGTGLNNKGNWVTGTTYNVGDYVFSRSTLSADVNSMWILQGTVSYLSNTIPYQDTLKWIELQAPKGDTGLAGQSMYLHIKYSHDGTTFSANSGETPDDYMGVLVNTIQADSLVFSDYTWKYVKGSTGATGTAGTNGTNGKTYSLLIDGGIRTIVYDGSGLNPQYTSSAYGCTLYEDGISVVPTSYSWSASGLLSGTAILSTFTPTINTTFSATANNYVTLTAIYNGITIINSIPISCNKMGVNGQDANLLDWVNSWNTGKTTIKGSSIVTPKLFAGTNTGTADVPNITGVAVGDVLGNGFGGVGVYKDNVKNISLNTDGTFALGTSGAKISVDSTGKASIDASQIDLSANSSVKVAVGQIGGNNLFRDGSFELGYNTSHCASVSGFQEAHTVATGYYSETPIEGSKIFATTATNPATKVFEMDLYPNISVKPNTKYTLSYYQNEDSTSSFYGTQNMILLFDSVGTYITEYWFDNSGYAGNFKIRKTYTFTTPSNCTQIRLRFGYQTVTIPTFTWMQLDCVKLEEGENATAWSPNPNELKSNIVEITDDHLRATFTDGSYSEMVPSGFHHVDGTGTKDYHYLSYSGTAPVSGANAVNVNIPSDFTGKDYKVILSVSSVDGGANTLMNSFAVHLGVCTDTYFSVTGTGNVVLQYNRSGYLSNYDGTTDGSSYNYYVYSNLTFNSITINFSYLVIA